MDKIIMSLEQSVFFFGKGLDFRRYQINTVRSSNKEKLNEDKMTSLKTINKQPHMLDERHMLFFTNNQTIRRCISMQEVYCFFKTY